MCGKKLTDGISGLTGSGSPLHVQEKHFEDAVKICIRRITPACAGKTTSILNQSQKLEDHSRVCRKNSVPCANDETPSGSPPRVREKLYYTGHAPNPFGITPACAGKTNAVPLVLSVSWDHPRVCGKNSRISARSLDSPGSPPRVREKRLHDCKGLAFSGITPACAGKTLISKCCEIIIRDHPRVCGKNFCSIETNQMTSGSPPRVREKLHQEYNQTNTPGITPACAGKTSVGIIKLV